MRKFRFKLQTVLDQRKRREDVLQAELGEIGREETTELARLADLHVKLRGAMSRMECLKVGRLEGYGSDPVTFKPPNLPTFQQYRQLDEYAQALRDDIKVQDLTIEAVRERLEAKRVEVVEAMRARKVIEALRDKRQHDYVSALARAEQGALDEMASLRYARGM
jgi:flagellar biosynthesis chaperone FliJ